MIIKELRKVFKKNHMKPLKKMSTNGKEENAPWREWFDEAMKRGAHTQLPEDILAKALARYPIQPHTGIKHKIKNIFLFFFFFLFFKHVHERMVDEAMRP